MKASPVLSQIQFSSVGDCSATVGALISLITPVPYAADFRPYFTIHDPAFQAMADAQAPTKSSKLPRLLGVTNLYFLKVSHLNMLWSGRGCTQASPCQ